MSKTGKELYMRVCPACGSRSVTTEGRRSDRVAVLQFVEVPGGGTLDARPETDEERAQREASA